MTHSSNAAGNKHKKAFSLSLSAQTVAAAQALSIDIAQECDDHLAELVAARQIQAWRNDHAGFIAAYNKILEDEGLPLDAVRSF